MTNMRSSLVETVPRGSFDHPLPPLVTLVLPKNVDSPFCRMGSVEQSMMVECGPSVGQVETSGRVWKDDPYLYAVSPKDELVTPRLPSRKSQLSGRHSAKSRKSDKNSFVFYESPNVLSTKAPSNKRLSNLQKKLKKQQSKCKKPQTWTRSCNKPTPHTKTHKTESMTPIPQATLSNIIIRSFKKHSKKLNRHMSRVDSSDLKINLTGVRTTAKEPSLRKSPLNFESSINCSIEVRDHYMSSCNLVSTHRMDTLDVSTQLSALNVKSVYDQQQNSMDRSICFKSHQRNEVVPDKSEFLKNKHNLDSKIALIDQKLRQIDQKLSTLHTHKNTPSSALFSKKKHSVKSAISAKMDRKPKKQRHPKLTIQPNQRKKGSFNRSRNKHCTKTKYPSKLNNFWQKSPMSLSLHGRKPAKTSFARPNNLFRLNWSNPSSLKSTFRSKNSNFRESTHRDSDKCSYEVNTLQPKNFINLYQL